MTHLAWNDAHAARQSGDRSSTTRANLLGYCEQIVGTSISFVVGSIELIACWKERARQRKALVQLDDSMLHDIGITRYDAEHEAAKPFWR